MTDQESIDAFESIRNDAELMYLKEVIEYCCVKGYLNLVVPLTYQLCELREKKLNDHGIYVIRNGSIESSLDTKTKSS